MAEAKRIPAPASGKGMSRRNMLAAFPALGAALGAPAIAAARHGDEPETPVMRAFREWKACRDPLYFAARDIPEAEFYARCDQLHDMESAMFELPNSDLRDAVLKVMAFTSLGTEFAEDSLGTIDRLLIEMGELAGAFA